LKRGCAVWHTAHPGRQHTQALPHGAYRELNLPFDAFVHVNPTRAPWLQAGKPSLIIVVGVRMECHRAP
jgi:hypothetical protein